MLVVLLLAGASVSLVGGIAFIGLTVSIGQENDYSGIKDCSIITATYHLDGELLGSMAVLGPTRMEYGKTMSLLNYMNQNLTEVIKRLHW